MDDFGESSGSAALAEAGNIQQNISNATINAVSGNQLHITASNIEQTPTDGNLRMPYSEKGTVTLAVGGHVEQQFFNANVNVIGGNQYNYTIYPRQEADHITGGDGRKKNKVPEIVKSPVFHPKYYSMKIKLIEKTTAEYLMQNLKYQLRQDITPAQKLDIFTSLKEAAALEILEGYAQDLDFSNYPLTPAVLNTLCSVIGNLGTVKSLSFNNCEIDDDLLSVLAFETKRRFIKIGKFDMRKNTSWSNVDSLLEVLANMEVTTLLMDIPRDEQKCEDIVQKLLKATERTVYQAEIGSLECLRISIKEFEEIAKSNLRLTKIKQLWISSDEVTFVKELWRATFQRISCSVDHCIVELPRVKQTNIIHLHSWTDVAETAKVGTVKEVSVHSDQPVTFRISKIEEIETMIGLNFCVTVKALLFHGYTHFTSKIWRDLGTSIRNCNVSTISFMRHFETVPNLEALQKGHAALAARRFTVASNLPKLSYQMELSIRDSTNETSMPDAVSENRKKSLDVKVDWMKGGKFAVSLGRIIATSGFEELVFRNHNSPSDDTITSIGKGLNQYKIKRLAVAATSIQVLLDSVSTIHAKNIYVQEWGGIPIAKNFCKARQINILSKEDWQMRFRNDE